MSTTDNFAAYAPTKAMPLIDAEKIALQCAINAVTELNKYNGQYVQNTKDLPDNFDFVDLEQAPDEESQPVRMLARYYLVLLNRRGLVDF
jgi:hypothetical protein